MRVYETQMIATGLSRYDVHANLISSLRQEGERLVYREVPYTGSILSRAYATELVRVSVYSDSPKIWAEELSPDCVYFFMQQPQHLETTR
jgi:hypothetical protein